MTYRQNSILITLLLFVVSCKTSTNTSSQNEKSTDIFLIPDSLSKVIDTSKTIWQYDDVTEIPVRIKNVDPDTISPQKLIDLINKHHGQDKIFLELVKVSRDTIYVTIKESTYLTQNTGTTGADAYISTAVYTLTELKDIKYVNLNFTEGDHAQPGTYSRQYYIDRSKKNTYE